MNIDDALETSAEIVAAARANRQRVRDAARPAVSPAPAPRASRGRACAPYITARSYLESRGFGERFIVRAAPALGREVARRYTGPGRRMVDEGTSRGRTFRVAAYPTDAEEMFDRAFHVLMWDGTPY